MKKYLPLLLLSLLLSACGPAKKTTTEFTPETETESDSASDITPYADKFATEKINLTETRNLDQEFKISYKTFNPDGVGTVDFKAKSMKVIDTAGSTPADNGKKLVLVELSVKGYKSNQGSPSTFNQVGDTPSPQFVLIDKANNRNYVEETFFSDTYTAFKKLFELSKLTLDGEQWVTTAIVFQIDKNLEPDLAFRFINKDGKIEFYDIK